MHKWVCTERVLPKFIQQIGAGVAGLGALVPIMLWPNDKSTHTWGGADKHGDCGKGMCPQHLHSVVASRQTKPGRMYVG